MHVHHVGAEAAHGGGHVVLVAPAAQQRDAPRPPGSPRPSDARAARAPTPARRSARELQLHRALLAALDAVAVVDHQDAHPPGYAIRPMDPPAVTVVVPTRGRAAYLEVTLRSLLAQRTGTAHELLVVDDGSADDTRAVAARLGVRCVSHGEPRSLNAARNTGLRESRRAAGRLRGRRRAGAARAGSTRWPRGRAPTRRPRRSAGRSGRASRAAGRAAAGARSRRSPRSTWARRTARRTWSGARTSPCAARRSSASAPSTSASCARTATRRSGSSACARPGAGSSTWPRPGSTTAAAPRTPGCGALARAAYARGRAARASDRRRGRAPGLGAELRVLAGCGWHTVRRACPQGVVMGAHSAGRVAETLRPLPAREGRPR